MVENCELNTVVDHVCRARSVRSKRILQQQQQQQQQRVLHSTPTLNPPPPSPPIMQSSATLPHAIDSGAEDSQSREEVAAAIASDTVTPPAPASATAASATAAAAAGAHYLSLPVSPPLPTAAGDGSKQLLQYPSSHSQPGLAVGSGSSVQMSPLGLGEETSSGSADPAPLARHIHDGPNPGEESDEEGGLNDDEEEAEHFEKMTSAQMRMGAIFGRADDSESMQLRSDNNIIIFMAVYVATVVGWILVDDDWVSLWINPFFLGFTWAYFYVVPERKRRWKTLAHFFALDDEIHKSKLLPGQTIKSCTMHSARERRNRAPRHPSIASFDCSRLDLKCVFVWLFSAQVPTMMMGCLVIHSLMILTIGYVWTVELEGIPRGEAWQGTHARMHACMHWAQACKHAREESRSMTA